jgi:hypothetical protein
MFQLLSGIRASLILSTLSVSCWAITPSFNVNQEIDFGTVMPATGSCLMFPETGQLAPFQGNFVCTLPDGSQNGVYTIIANPNKQVQVKFLPSLDNGEGFVFNPRVSLVSDSDRKYIVNNIGFVNIDSGSSGIINLYLGGELTINSILPTNQTIQFNFADAIEWDELN